MRGWVFLIVASLAGPVTAHSLPPCDTADFQTFRHVDPDEVLAHGGKDIAPVTEAFGSVAPYDFWIDYVIDETGHVSCMSAANRDESPLTLTPERQALLDDVAGWTFTPFTSADQPEKAWAEHYVTEVERPKTHMARPQGELSSVQFQLENHGHRSPDHGFILVVTGDGTVTYTLEDGQPDYLFGPQTYHIPPEQVATMLDIAEQVDYWSLRDVYRSYLPPGREMMLADTYYSRVAITIGGTSKDMRIYDAGGKQGAGISDDTYRLMYKLADIARIRLWQTLSPDTIAQIETDGFDFASDRGGEILLRMISNKAFPDSAIADVIARGAPVDYVGTGYFILPETSMLDAAIEAHRTAMVDDLIAKGALLSDGKPDSHKLSRALAHAVANAEPDMVTKFLAYRPDLTLTTSVKYDDKTNVESDPIITMVGEETGLDAYFDPETPLPDLIAVTQQLLDAGADINSHGPDGSLIAKALSGDNVPFAKWLMSKGAVLDTSVWIASHDEDTTLFLLDNGAQVDDEIMQNVVEQAKDNRQPKVEAWLKAHGKWPVD